MEKFKNNIKTLTKIKHKQKNFDKLFEFSLNTNNDFIYKFKLILKFDNKISKKKLFEFLKNTNIKLYYEIKELINFSINGEYNGIYTSRSRSFKRSINLFLSIFLCSIKNKNIKIKNNKIKIPIYFFVIEPLYIKGNNCKIKKLIVKFPNLKNENIKSLQLIYKVGYLYNNTLNKEFLIPYFAELPRRNIFANPFEIDLHLNCKLMLIYIMKKNVLKFPKIYGSFIKKNNIIEKLSDDMIKKFNIGISNIKLYVISLNSPQFNILKKSIKKNKKTYIKYIKNENRNYIFGTKLILNFDPNIDNYEYKIVMLNVNLF